MIGGTTAGGRGGRPRAVLLVPNPAAPYSRAMRIARSLADAGYEVEVAAVAVDGLPREEQHGDVVLRRYAAAAPGAPLPSGLAVHQGATEPKSGPVVDRGPAAAPGAEGHQAGPSAIARLVGLPRFVVGRTRRTVFRIRRTLAWPYAVRGWWATLARELPPADLYHAFGIQALGGAVALADAARRAGRTGAVVYDVIDLAIENYLNQDQRRVVLALYRRRERGWVRRSRAFVTVNEPLAAHVQREWQLADRPTVLLNCPPRLPLEDPPEPLIARAASVPPGRRLVLFLGRLGPERGLETAAEAVLHVRDAALVLIGFGQWQDAMRAQDSAPGMAGRHYTLPAVPMDEVPRWAASADVSLVPLPSGPLSYRLSTPNKFWESIAGGTPVVVSRELEVMAGIVEREGLGATFEGATADALAGAIRAVLDAPDAERRAMRQRVLDAARERYHWDAVVEPYLRLVASLVAERSARVTTAATA